MNLDKNYVNQFFIEKSGFQNILYVQRDEF